MDIQYLLFLQDFRISINDALTPFLEWVSLFGISYIVLFPVFVYWCLDKRKGLMILSAWKISQTLNAMVKLTACIYRPWVRDPRVIPAGDAIRTAGGYSFPSGHTMMVTPIYGGLALCTQKKTLRAFWLLAILVTMFSRNYLGVHTPQDVVVGFILGIASIYIAEWFLGYIDRNPNKAGTAMFICGAVGILTLVYVTYKPYPMDYVDGKLLVDPVKMQIDAWGDAGGLAAFALAWYIERRWIKFSPTGWNVKGVIICAVGLLAVCWMIGTLKDVTKNTFGPHAGKLVYQFAFFFFVMIVWPMVLKLCGSGKKE